LAEILNSEYANIRKAVSKLINGHPIVFPTDTLFALGCPINCENAVEEIFEIKRRPLSMALPVLIGRERDVNLVAENISEASRKLMRDFWPGALTILLQKKQFVPNIVTAGLPTVAVRFPNHQVALDIIRGVDVPVIGTSANIHNEESPLTAQGINAHIGHAIDLIIDDGKTHEDLASTIIDMSSDKPRILRQGKIPRDVLEKYCYFY